MVNVNEKTYEEMYLSYLNDFLTVERFAEYYGVTESQAINIIDIGRAYNHAKAKQVKIGS